jgi:hypothetical protein
LSKYTLADIHTSLSATAVRAGRLRHFRPGKIRIAKSEFALSLLIPRGLLAGREFLAGQQCCEIKDRIPHGLTWNSATVDGYAANHIGALNHSDTFL